MRDGGKGDAQRPLVVPMDQFDESWDTIFNQKKEKDIKIEIDADNDGQSITFTKEWHFNECGK